MSYDFDLFVIGAGSGGVRAARIAAGHGARVAIAEEHRYGGTCVIRGCIPKKLLVYASEFQHEFADAHAYGWNVAAASFDWPTLIAAKNKEIARLEGIYAGILEKHGVKRFDARATLASKHTIDVAGTQVSAGIILIATGGTPILPDSPGIGNAITSNEAFELEALPRHITIVGGGYIAVEFAQIFRGMGAQVSLVHRREWVLRGFDHDVRVAVTEGLRKAGVKLHMQQEVRGAERRDPNTVTLSLSGGGAIETNAFMCATGRRPNTRDLGLEIAGVELTANGAVKVDTLSRSSIGNIYAVGDCTDRINLTPVAIAEGHAFADSVFGKAPRAPDHMHVASAVFSQPPVGTVGLTEAAARAQGSPIDVYKTSFRPLRHTLTGRDEKALIKLIVDRASQRVVGAHIVAAAAPEIIQALAIAVRMGATKADIDATMAVHPTTAEELVLMRTPQAD